MSFITAAAIVGGTSLLGAYVASNASKSAANTVANASTAGQQQMQGNLQALSPNYTPYMNLGQTGVNQLNAQLPDLTQSFGPQQLQSNLAPNYQFMLNQGLGAQSQAMNVGGGGSNINTANTKFAEDYASNAYQNAFNNYQTQQSNIFNRLASVAGIGSNAVSGLSNLATGTASNITQLGVGGAQATAAGITGSANAISSGIQGAGQAYSNAVTLPAILNAIG
jgi:hypothetical protein